MEVVTGSEKEKRQEALGTYRHELKYQISMADCFAIRQRLRPVMKPDEHTGEDGKYTTLCICGRKCPCYV